MFGLGVTFEGLGVPLGVQLGVDDLAELPLGVALGVDDLIEHGNLAGNVVGLQMPTFGYFFSYKRWQMNSKIEFL